MTSPDLIERLEKAEGGSLLCPECGEDTPSTEAFETLGVIACAECAADLFDAGDGFPDDLRSRGEAGR